MSYLPPTSTPPAVSGHWRQVINPICAHAWRGSINARCFWSVSHGTDKIIAAALTKVLFYVKEWLSLKINHLLQPQFPVPGQGADWILRSLASYLGSMYTYNFKIRTSERFRNPRPSWFHTSESHKSLISYAVIHPSQQRHPPSGTRFHFRFVPRDTKTRCGSSVIVSQSFRIPRLPLPGGAGGTSILHWLLSAISADLLKTCGPWSTNFLFFSSPILSTSSLCV